MSTEADNTPVAETGDKRKASQEPVEVEDVKKQKTTDEPSSVTEAASANASAKAPESYAEPGDTEGLPEEEGKSSVAEGGHKETKGNGEKKDDDEDEEEAEVEGEEGEGDAEEVPVEKDEVDPKDILPEDETTGRRPKRRAAAKKVDYSSEAALKKAGIDPEAPEEDDDDDAPAGKGDDSMDVSGDLEDDDEE